MKGITGVLAIVVSIGSILAIAAPTVQVKGGRTSVGLSGELLDALVSAGCELERVKPASVKPGGDRVRFPIGGGALDLNAGLGEVEHRGGLTLSCPDVVDPNDIHVVTLENLRIEALDPNGAEDPNDVTRITALASVENELFDRIELLLPGEDGIAVSGNGGTLKLRGNGLTFAPEGLEFLSNHLGVEIPPELVVGDSVSQLNIRTEKSKAAGKPEHASSKGKAKGKDKDKDKDKDEDEDESEDDD